MQNKAKKKELESNYNHLELDELERKGKREEFLGKGELLSHLTLCSAHGSLGPSAELRCEDAAGMRVKPQSGAVRCHAARPPCAAALLLNCHQETLAPCNSEARKEVCPDSKYQLHRQCLLGKLSNFRSEFTFFPL